ncbi:MAG: putative molybdenum carrier protein [Bacteroidales bacterium]|nr:putative molybdenum carrier protein [Bacteroidales bacterium]MCF8404704.1 putative molybdenum carrier protein [Bacteroidales bacterium]
MQIIELKIISGGQTGVDRAALDFALKNKLKTGGWCPRGRKAEDGVISDLYPLKETPSADYQQRTRKNIEESDGTLIIFNMQMDKGTSLTFTYCNEINKPHFLIDLHLKKNKDDLFKWINDNNIRILNIAGPRESYSPGIYFMAKKRLESVLGYTIN